MKLGSGGQTAGCGELGHGARGLRRQMAGIGLCATMDLFSRLVMEGGMPPDRGGMESFKVLVARSGRWQQSKRGRWSIER